MLSNASAQSGLPGAAYTMTNAVPNAVIVYDRSSSGLLTQAGAFATGGNGTGTGLGNQGGVVLSRNIRDQVIVSEAFGGAANASALSSYIANADGTLTLVSASVAT